MPQAAQRRAEMGISVRHSGHSRVVGVSTMPRFRRSAKWFIGTTTKK
jgi:hypothetical protein